ncbi:hypothetical protein NBRC110019_09680 [Neptunitalea chrysea]|uniref:Outer membrane protein beta-barrel domain-containing protein n=1 Tax=Neptunitalea chrysea TaxID=1647581 RepID=A0A9W6B609_9FLAO|nr:hypothetical protein [Neptunitalea chrysea]GLB51929.1 hypothetical protein NBRC110019_09680 [Neptunitalea chrysea]
MNRLFLCISLYFVAQNIGFSQAETAELYHDKSIAKSVRLSIGIGHAHIKKGVQYDDDGISLASFYFDADYWVSNRVAVGLQTDLILEDYLVEHSEEDRTFERNSPIAVVPVMVYRPLEHFLVIGGYGVEFSEGESFSMARAGVEYGIELPKKFEFGISLIYDVKLDAYDTWVFGVGISKFFGGKDEHVAQDEQLNGLTSL